MSPVFLMVERCLPLSVVFAIDSLDWKTEAQTINIGNRLVFLCLPGFVEQTVLSTQLHDRREMPHVGDAVRPLLSEGAAVLGIDRLPLPYTDLLGDLGEPAFVRGVMSGVTQVLHTTTLHKPQVKTHTRQAFVDTNITDTLNLLKGAAAELSCPSRVDGNWDHSL